MIAAGCCCCPIVAIIVSNSNSEKDDNFDVYLNGKNLGNIDNNDPSRCTGRIFATQSGPSCTNLSFAIPLVVNLRTICNDRACAFQPLVTFDKSLLINGINTLQLLSTQNNHNGNFGAINIVGLRPSGDKFVVCKVYSSGSYSDASRDPGDAIYNNISLRFYP